MNRKFPAKPPAPARPLQKGDFVRVTDWDGIGQVTSVDAEHVWVSLQDRYVRTGWRPANGYLPADVTHVDEGRIHDPAEAERLAYAEAAEPEGEPADIGEDDGEDRTVLIEGDEDDPFDGHAPAALVQLDRDDAKARVIAAALVWEEELDARAEFDSLSDASARLVAAGVATGRLAAAVRDYRALGGESR